MKSASPVLDDGAAGWDVSIALPAAGEGPIFLQVARAVTRAIQRGRLRAGARSPLARSGDAGRAPRSSPRTVGSRPGLVVASGCGTVWTNPIRPPTREVLRGKQSGASGSSSPCPGVGSRTRRVRFPRQRLAAPLTSA